MCAVSLREKKRELRTLLVSLPRSLLLLPQNTSNTLGSHTHTYTHARVIIQALNTRKIVTRGSPTWLDVWGIFFYFVFSSFFLEKKQQKYSNKKKNTSIKTLANLKCAIWGRKFTLIRYRATCGFWKNNIHRINE